MFDPLGMAPPAAAPELDADWQRLVAALRTVAPAVASVAARELDRPSWRPGQQVEDAAFAEGRKAVWRQILAALDDGARSTTEEGR
jgi:hypothetical protein